MVFKIRMLKNSQNMIISYINRVIRKKSKFVSFRKTLSVNALKTESYFKIAV